MSSVAPYPVDRANANIARHLGLMAAAQPTRPALKIPRGRSRKRGIDYLTLDFAELDAEVNAWAARLTAAGAKPGDRTLVMVRQGLPLIASVFALFRIGAIPVVIDPGMGRKNFLACVARSRPRVLVGIPVARLMSRIFRAAFSSVMVRVPASGSLTARLGSRSGAASAPEAGVCWPAGAGDLAAVLFTSGSTGAPKGVCYEHGMFEAQVQLIRETYGIAPGEIDLPMLPIFALFNPALGMTTVVPEIDPRRPAEVDAARIVQAIQQEGVTNSFGSPTLWHKIAQHCAANNIKLPSLRRVLCAGAPVPAALWAASHDFLPTGKLHSPYGATEALPVTSIYSDEIDLTSVRGSCVGRPLDRVDVKVVRITDAPIATLVEASPRPEGEIGEIIVRGPNVTKTYDGLPPATAAAKIRHHYDTLGHDRTEVWHRMGDCGYFDAHGRLWFCGRKAERVETAIGTLHTEPCEQVFRSHPRVSRCALIGLGERPNQRAAIVVETKVRNSADGRVFARELRKLALEHDHTTPIKLFYFCEKFPVDVRHNAKIHRLSLAHWAATAIGFESDPKR
ncbi:MAG: fatty acid CoA ligase family protein [Opitutaceae bacterium]|nr:fatty acid CoA ligase family protein [Opitutaceae bacterium]